MKEITLSGEKKESEKFFGDIKISKGFIHSDEEYIKVKLQTDPGYNNEAGVCLSTGIVSLFTYHVAVTPINSIAFLKKRDTD